MNQPRIAVLRLSAVLLLLGMTWIAGCTGGGKGTVTGQVSFQGKPLPNGRISFVCQEGKQAVYSSEIKEGAYTIPDCPAGAVKITVETFKPVKIDPKLMPKGLGITRDRDPNAPATAAPDTYVKIPERYGSTETSGLTYSVIKGPQTHDIPLTP